jgi:membrane protein
MISPREIIRQIANHVQQLLTSPTTELSRAQRALRYAYELASHCISELGNDQALQMAAALTFRTIFSLIPLFVLALVVFRLSGGLDEKRVEVQDKLYNYLGLNFTAGSVDADAMTYEMPENGKGAPSFGSGLSMDDINRVLSESDTTQPGATSATQPGDVGEALAAQQAHNNEIRRRETRASLDKIIQDLTDKVSNTSASGITVVGLILLIWAAVALVVTVEQSLNQVYGTPTGRPWHMKILLYWGIITLGPLLLAVSLYVAGQIMTFAQTLGPIGWLVQQLSRFTALAASWLLLFLLYVLMPNTHVAWRPAAIGAFVAACLWEIGKWGFKLYAANAGFATLYGSLGMIPLFLYWVYITWTIVLFGAELSYTLQAMKGKEFKHQARRADRQVVVDPRWVIPVLVAMGRDFEEGKASTEADLAHRLSIPHQAVSLLNRKLVEAGLIHCVEGSDEAPQGYALAKAPDRVPVQQVMEVGMQIVTGKTQTRADAQEWQYLRALTAADEQYVGQTTLADLIRKKQD